MELKDPQISDILKHKYPIEYKIIKKEGYDLSRCFTDDFNNYIIMEKDNENIITVTFLYSELSRQETFEKRNEGTFFIIENVNDFKQLIKMNLVFLSNYNPNSQDNCNLKPKVQ